MRKGWLVVYKINPNELYCPLSHIVCETIEHLQDVIVSISQYDYKLIDVTEIIED